MYGVDLVIVQRAIRVAILMIAYDLHPVEGRTYNGLYETIKGLGTGWWRGLDSAWLVITTKTTDQIRDELARHLGRDDRLIVMSYGKGAAWVGLGAERAYWLSENL